MVEMRDDDRQFDLPRREEEILKFWEENKIFEKTLAKTQQGRPFIFYEGPPYANGLPGIHHFEARVFKDIIIRYRTMRGFFVPRKAGWDTHGLPIEMAVEKELGVKAKRDIEKKIGIGKFVEAARASVFGYKAEWEKFTRRIGYWLDLDHAYLTMSPQYIESLWWVIKEFAKKKLLYEDFKVVPWCTRCETPLSSHELGQAYDTVKDRSVYVRFRVTARSRQWANTSILSWTTTPWTLPGNVALAVNAREEYVIVPDPAARRQWVVVSRRALDHLIERGVFPPEYRNLTMLDDVSTLPGAKLVGLEYEPLFRVKELISPKSHRVYPADFVTVEEGTGVVHTAVMYGEDDYRLGTKVGLPKFHTVAETGHFIKGLGEGLGGGYVKEAKTEEKIIASLRRRGLLFAEGGYEHDYPFCWRCDTPLLYYARQGWWVKVSARRKQLLANNEKINWMPAHVKHGRFGEFLKEARDWSFSRERYWGTPLPVWRCRKCRHQEVIGSLAELSRLAQHSGNRYLAMRHGEAENNVRGTISSGWPERQKSRLTPRGRAQVERAAEGLRRSGIDLIVASDFTRTRETAELVARRLKVRGVGYDARLREVREGRLDGKPRRAYARYFASPADRFTKRAPGGETLPELRGRVMAALRDLEAKHRGKTILIVSHEYPIWMLYAGAQGLADRETLALRTGRRAEGFVGYAEVRTFPYRALPRDGTGAPDLHRPYVDGYALVCPKCSGAMRRVSEVVDVWFDSGAMPFAQAHYPFEHKKALPYPADYICEGVDQTRGWFYTLLAVSTLLGRGPSYRNVVSLGHVLDRDGQKMSKSRGNIVEPGAVIAKYGSDAIRWYFFTVNAPGDPKRFDEKDILLRHRGALSTLWNSFVFFDTYVDKAKRDLRPELRSREKRKAKSANVNVLDRWVVAKLDELAAGVTGRLGDYDIVGAARALDQFIVEDFSNWYLRRSRRRFQRPASRAEKDEAAAVTGWALLRLSELMAPFTPFLAEIIYRELKVKLGLKEESVHLRSWPSVRKVALRPAQGGSRLLAGMAEVRRLAALALAKRAKAGIKVRQPLAELKVKSLKVKVPDLIEVLREEVNVKAVVVDPKISGEVELDTELTGELREEGIARELVRNIQELRREAGLKPGQAARCRVSGDRDLESIVARWHRTVERETNCALTVGGRTGGGPAVALDGRPIRISVKKA